MVKKIIASFLSFIFIAGFAQVLLASASGIEQVSLYLPEVKVYLHSNTALSNEDVKLYLNDEELTVDNVEKYNPEKHRIVYYLLVDTSTSIGDETFDAMKKVLLSFYDKLAEQDEVVLLSFGGEIKLRLNGHIDKSVYDSTVQLLQNNGNKTLLFQTLQEVAEMSSDATKEESRKIAFVITDGKNTVIDQTTINEAQNALVNTQVPVYSLLASSTESEYVQTFGEFARATGGEIALFNPSDSVSPFNEIFGIIQNCWIITGHGKNNKTVSGTKIRVKNLKTGIVNEVIFSPVFWPEDTVAPQITDILKVGRNQLKIIFSEDVANAENPSNYEIKFSGGMMSIKNVVYLNDHDNYYALITLNEPVYAAKYSITTYHITDNSMEQNPVGGPFTKKTEGLWPVLFYLRWIFTNLWWVFILLAIAAVSFIAYRILKKREGLVKMDGKLLFSDRIEKKQIVNLVDHSKRLHLNLHINGKNAFDTDIELHNSIIIGRSDICDVKINDNKMSRQHFSLENTDNGLILSDLNTTNGTFVNGVKVIKPRKIALGDTITAGSCNMVFTGG